MTAHDTNKRIMLLVLAALVLVQCALVPYTKTMMFTSAQYANMTKQTAASLFKLSRRDPYNFRDAYRVDIHSFDGHCERYKPFRCLDLSAIVKSHDYYALTTFRMVTLLAELGFPSMEIDGVLMLDSDVVLYRNVVDRMARYGTDLVFQRELPCSNVNCVNAGFWWARAHKERVTDFIRYAIILARTLRIPDQDALDLALQKYGDLTVTYLPVDRYPNGFVLDANVRLNRNHLHLVHVNWRTMDKKQSTMDRLINQQAPVVDQDGRLVCAKLRELDRRNLWQVLACNTTKSCRAAMTERCG